MKNLLRVSLAILGMAVVVRGIGLPLQATVEPVVAATNDLPEELTDEQFLSKIAENIADGRTCEHLADETAHEHHEVEAAKVDVAGKQITVSSLVQRALDDQRRLLGARASDLERWSRADQLHFAKWFGTNSNEARELIYQRIHILAQLNEEYSVGNFRKAVPSRQGIFAFVHPGDPSKIFVDTEFVRGSFLGENSRAGTICHEMSHFTVAGGTKDIVYGATACKRLARLSPPHALSNADSFEYYLEGVR